MSNEYLDWLSDNLISPDFEKEVRDPERIPMKTYWNIVPKDNRCTYMGYINGEYVQHNKGSKIFDTSLLFDNKDRCLEYIKDNLDLDKYIAEKILLDEKYYGLK